MLGIPKFLCEIWDGMSGESWQKKMDWARF